MTCASTVALVSRFVQRGAVAGLLAALSAFAAAAPAVLPATPTTIEGTAERLISYRHQDHMWQTPDGATHALVNTGTQPDGAALRLYTSVDNGLTWVPGLALANSTEATTSDGFIDGNRLFATYQTGAGTIVFVRLEYDPVLQTWQPTLREAAFQSSTVAGVNPAVARDQQGRFWLAFTATDKASGQHSIKMLHRAQDEPWVDTGLQFGASDNLAIERSARPVATPNGMGLVYTVHQTTSWALRRNDAPLDAAWASYTVYTRKSPETDPYASHFNVVADADNNLHMVVADGGRALYFRQLASEGRWRFRMATESANSVYAQMVVSGSRLMMIVNSETSLRVFASLDQGSNWVNTHLLTHPRATSGISYQRPRVEAPSYAASPVPVLQQYAEDGVQRLMSFQVPVISEAVGSRR